MIETPHITDIPSQTIAFIPIVVERDKIQEVMHPGIQEVFAAVQAQGIAITGHLFTHHNRITDETFDFEICVPVASAVTPVGRVQPGERRAARTARTIYHGPYEGLGEAWGEFKDWIADQKLNPASDLWECYLAGPESSDDPTAWRTELNRPLL